LSEKSRRGQHPNSQANLALGGRPTTYNEAKKNRSVTVTDVGWDGLKAIARAAGLTASELIERIGRGEIEVSFEE
jgi:predicted DNA-binding ribbon-helix-helix protein